MRTPQWNSPFERRAAHFAMDAHAGQKRKYTNEPYIVHPAEVAGIVASVPHTPIMVAAAWLHDVMEDCDVKFDELADKFNWMLAGQVEWLTDISQSSDGNRATRKDIDLRHIAEAPPEMKTVKLADLISNTRSIVANDPKFAKVYLAEKRRLLEVLKEGDSTLWALASALALEKPR